MRVIKAVLFLSFFISPLFAQDFSAKPDFKTTEEILSEYHDATPTKCASKIFSDALYAHADEISENDAEFVVRAWAHNTMTDANVLEQVIKCPEITSVADDTTIIFTPIFFTFGNGRNLQINYSTQPQVLKQKILLSRKRSLPNGDANPALMDPNDPAKYLNAEPSWYAIMVVQHDSLKDFVGPGKNNTLSMKYLDEHIDDIYPKGYYCTSKSALANDNDTINQTVREVVDIEDDSNDYYVAGDVNLEWIMYAEIAADVVITIITLGGGQIATGAIKGTRAAKTGIKLFKNVKRLEKLPRVAKYSEQTAKIAQYTTKIERLGGNVKNAKKYEKALKNLERAKRAGNAADIAKYEKEAKEIFNAAKKIDPEITEELLKNADNISSEIKTLSEELPKMEKELAEFMKKNKELLEQKRKLLDAARRNADPLSIKDYEAKLKELNSLRDSQKSGIEIQKIKNAEKRAQAVEKNEQITRRIEELERTIADYENASSLGDYAKLRKEIDELESVDKYIENMEQIGEILKYHKNLFAFKRPQTGNIITRNLKRVGAFGKSLRAANTGAKTLRKAGKVARAGMSSRSAKIGHWLFDQTLKHGSRLAKFERDIGALYGVISFLGDMYDHTSNTSKEFSNGIEFKPLCLLSADDLAGQENVVNYGMWLMWTGNSTDPADDDAAYLQAMDFAAKFFYQLDEFQDEHGAECNVDIYVVHPIIRLDETNLDEPAGEMFYLFMNEIPWTTAEQFGEKVPDIDDWTRAQSDLYSADPEYKYHERKSENESFSESE